MDWEYENHSNRGYIAKKCLKLQSGITKDPIKFDSTLKDTRDAHKFIFKDVTPVGYPKFAGYYRGSNIDYLKSYEVEIAGYAGYPAGQVSMAMKEFHNNYLTEILRLRNEAKNNKLSPADKLLFLSEIISDYMVTFLSIHPYANGNGHIGRLLVWMVFIKFKYQIQDWSIDIRPPQPFDDLISMYRNQDKEPLMEYFIKILISKRLP